MTRKANILVIFTLMVVGPPLIGIYLSGRSVELFASFPPLTVTAEHSSFSWPVFLLYLVPTVGILGLIIIGFRRQPQKSADSVEIQRRIPWWGWVALTILIASWFIAWTRFSWFAPYQRLTFIPLWFSYIVCANALCVRQSGSCPLLHESLFFAGLFPLSAVFWWFFEYLNQFVLNWFYTGVDYGPLGYSIHATISFSTVLPAVYTTRELLFRMAWFRNRFHGFPSFGKSIPGFVNWLVLLISAAGLTGIGLWPEELFFLLWGSPLLILTTLRHIARQPTLLSVMAAGDWRPAMSAALAALVCGVFWEMWNFYSLAKWIYSIPYVHRFKIFEMPILGYMGYLPFGLLCIEIVDFFKLEKKRH